MAGSHTFKYQQKEFAIKRAITKQEVSARTLASIAGQCIWQESWFLENYFSGMCTKWFASGLRGSPATISRGERRPFVVDRSPKRLERLSYRDQNNRSANNIGRQWFRLRSVSQKQTGWRVLGSQNGPKIVQQPRNYGHSSFAKCISVRYSRTIVQITSDNISHGILASTF